MVRERRKETHFCNRLEEVSKASHEQKENMKAEKMKAQSVLKKRSRQVPAERQSRRSLLATGRLREWDRFMVNV